MVQLDNFTTEQKQKYIIATTSIGLVLSTVSMVARIFARLRTINGVRQEDWCMVVGLLLSYGTAICLLYGVPVQGVPLPQLSPKERKDFLLMIWIIQKIQPPTLFAIKLSIIIFQVHIFQSQTFRRISWAVAIFTAIWMVANILGTTFQCSPPSYFYDKSGGPTAGSCIHDPVHRMGVPNAILSSVGDIIIFAMPIPPLLKLTIPRRTKIGLIGVFSLGVFVLISSFFRWIALIGADPRVFNSAQIQVGVWTYLEMSVAITCGNLPFLAPLLGCVGPRRRTSSSGGRQSSGSSSLIKYFSGRRRRNKNESSETKRSGTPIDKPLPCVPLKVEVAVGDNLSGAQRREDGFTRMYDSPVSEEEVEFEMQNVKDVEMGLEDDGPHHGWAR
ncbi:hypothetical protein QBC38DRAFT_513670 [Podospora fimiseda]|uniref:Rhodopsin domain-containing protein n=1 Tax=Podospora fimiseda TaxID=252190 RepID=A0AAN7BGG8_9PEZI|nr:hypothetical protein QBC38DRAFT_513670 [Podospora fimiseda]